LSTKALYSARVLLVDVLVTDDLLIVYPRYVY
jgi:hypothetical protein